MSSLSINQNPYLYHHKSLNLPYLHLHSQFITKILNISLKTSLPLILSITFKNPQPSPFFPLSSSYLSTSSIQTQTSYFLLFFNNSNSFYLQIRNRQYKQSVRAKSKQFNKSCIKFNLELCTLTSSFL